MSPLFLTRRVSIPSEKDSALPSKSSVAVASGLVDQLFFPFLSDTIAPRSFFSFFLFLISSKRPFAVFVTGALYWYSLSCPENEAFTKAHFLGLFLSFSIFLQLSPLILLSLTILLPICSLILDWNGYSSLAIPNKRFCMHLPPKMSNTELIFSSLLRHFSLSTWTSSENFLHPRMDLKYTILHPWPGWVTEWSQSPKATELWWAPVCSGWTGKWRKLGGEAGNFSHVHGDAENLVCEKRYKQQRGRDMRLHRLGVTQRCWGATWPLMCGPFSIPAPSEFLPLSFEI